MTTFIRNRGSSLVLPVLIHWSDEQEREGTWADDAKYAAHLAETLIKHYPGHCWQVQVDSVQGVVNIKHPILSSRLGWRLKLKDCYSDPSNKEVIRAGGAMLERWGQPRGQMKDEIYTAEADFSDVPGLKNYRQVRLNPLQMQQLKTLYETLED